MSSIILSQTELDSYLSSLNLNDTNVIRVLNSIQLLAPRIYNDLLYYMVAGKITISQLSIIPINNVSAKGLIAAAVAGGSTALSKIRELESYFTSIPAWSDLCNTNSSIFFSRIFNPSKNLTVQCNLDETGVDKKAYLYQYQVIDAYYKSLSNTRYVDYTVLPLVNTTARNTLENTLNANGLGNLILIMDKEIVSNSLLSTVNLKIIPSLDPLATICGFVLRDLHNEPWRINFIDNMNTMYSLMANSYDLETVHTGALGIKNAMLSAWNTWAYIKSSTKNVEFIDNLVKISLLRLAVPNVYGTTEFTSLELSNENAEFVVIKESLEAVKVYLQAVIQNININLVV